MRFLPVLSVLLILVIFIVTGSLASVAMAFFIFLLGLFSCNTISDVNSKQYAQTVFNIVFIITTFLILIRYEYILNNPDSLNIFKTGGDEHDFYEIANEARGFKTFSDIFNDIFFVSVVENQGYVFYLRALSYISYNFFDGNHVVLQMLGSSLFGCLLAVILFKMLICYFSARKAFKYTITGFFISPFFYYSLMVLRDIHVAFVFSVMSYIVMRPYRVKGLIWLIVFMSIAFFLRMESGILSVAFLLIYVYMKSKNKLLVAASLAIVVIVFVFYTVAGNDLMEDILDVNEHYMNRTEDMGESSALVSLPHPIREIVMFIVHHFFWCCCYVDRI